MMNINLGNGQVLVTAGPCSFLVERRMRHESINVWGNYHGSHPGERIMKWRLELNVCLNALSKLAIV